MPLSSRPLASLLPPTSTPSHYHDRQHNHATGISVNGDALDLKFVTTQQYGTNVGSRNYLMDTPTTYKQFKLLNQEFTFDVDVSNLPCGACVRQRGFHSRQQRFFSFLFGRTTLCCGRRVGTHSPRVLHGS